MMMTLMMIMVMMIDVDDDHDMYDTDNKAGPAAGDDVIHLEFSYYTHLS